jgi:PAS domain-containing protein
VRTFFEDGRWRTRSPAFKVKRMSHLPVSSSFAWLKNRWLPPALLSVPALAVLLGAQWEAGSTVLAWGVAGFASTGLLLATGLVCVLTRRVWARDEARRQEELACAYMREAIEQLPAAIELYDPQDRLIVCNRQMEKMYPQHNRTRVLGQTYEALLREAVRQGLLGEVPSGRRRSGYASAWPPAAPAASRCCAACPMAAGSMCMKRARRPAIWS